MDLESLRTQREAFTTIIESDLAVSASEDRRMDALVDADLSEEELATLSADLRSRRIDIITQLMKMPTDNETFHEPTVTEDVKTQPDRGIDGRVWKTKTEETARNIEVPGMGMITVSVKHTNKLNKAGNGRVMQDQHRYEYSVQHAHPQPDDEDVAPKVVIEGDYGSWDYSLIASAEKIIYDGDEAIHNSKSLESIASVAEEVDSLENIAANVGVAVEKPAALVA